MKKLFWSLPLAITLLTAAGCSSKQQKEPLREYRYVAVVDDLDLFTNRYSTKYEDEETIMAPNDSVAYCEAYNNFMISKAVNEMIDNAYTIPRSFELYDDKANRVFKNVSDATLLDIEKDVYDMVFRDDPNYQQNEKVVIDSVKIEELKPYFDFSKDDFDPRGITWIQPKSRPSNLRSNHIYCYFMQEGESVKNFRIKIQYYADDWLFINKYQFAIDGNAYEYTPSSPERDHSGGMIWEWSDEAASLKEYDLIMALANGEDARIKYIGSQYHNIRTIPASQLNAIRQTVELYRAMGGKF